MHFIDIVAGSKTYLFATFITIVALVGMFTGKLDYAAGIQIISTAGVGAFLRSGIRREIAGATIVPPAPLQVPPDAAPCDEPAN